MHCRSRTRAFLFKELDPNSRFSIAAAADAHVGCQLRWLFGAGVACRFDVQNMKRG